MSLGKRKRMRYWITLLGAALLTAGIALPSAALSPQMLLKAAPSASAFPSSDTYWLRYEETVTLHADGTVEEAYHHTARLFRASGLENADVSIPYSTSSQTVTDVQARTILPDGSVLKVLPADIHETSPFSDFTLYDDAKNIAFSLPGVEEGALIDYQYKIVTHKPLERGRFADAWWLTNSDPSRLNRYTLIVPVGMPIGYQLHNGGGVQFTQSLTPDGKRRVYRWEQRNAPAFTPEPEMPAQETVAPWVEVSTWPSWQSVAGWYQRLASPRMAATPEITALVRRLTAGKTTQREKAQALFYWVEQKTRYVAIEMGVSAYQPHSAETVCRNRYGDCKDMATLLAAMFHAAGITTAWPALLDTENKQPLHDHLAAPTLFDHAILRADLDGRPYWFDATAEYCAFGDIPSADRGLEAFIVRNGAGRFETIPAGGPETNRTVYVKNVTLHPDGSADCRTVVHGDGDAALSARTELNALPPDQLRSHFEGLINNQNEATLLHYSVGGCENLGKPLTYGVQYTAPTWAIQTGPLLIVSDGFVFDTPTLQKSRRYPLQIEEAEQEDYTETIQLPTGCRVEALPENIHEDTPAGTLVVTYTSAPDCITIHKVVTLHPAVISTEAYPAMRGAFERFTQRIKEPIVLREEAASKIASVSK